MWNYMPKHGQSVIQNSILISIQKKYYCNYGKQKDFLEALMVTTLMDNVIVIDISEQNVIMSNKPSVKGDSHTNRQQLLKENRTYGLDWKALT